MFIAKTKYSGRRKKIIRRKTIGLSTEKWKELNIDKNAKKKHLVRRIKQQTVVNIEKATQNASQNQTKVKKIFSSITQKKNNGTRVGSASPVPSQEYDSCYLIVRFYVCCIVSSFCCTSVFLSFR